MIELFRASKECCPIVLDKWIFLLGKLLFIQINKSFAKSLKEQIKTGPGQAKFESWIYLSQGQARIQFFYEALCCHALKIQNKQTNKHNKTFARIIWNRAIKNLKIIFMLFYNSMMLELIRPISNSVFSNPNYLELIYLCLDWLFQSFAVNEWS